MVLEEAERLLVLNHGARKCESPVQGSRSMSLVHVRSSGTHSKECRLCPFSPPRERLDDGTRTRVGDKGGRGVSFQ